MRVIDLENINNAMRNETQFVLRCEEVYHDKISAAAASILSTRQERPVVALTGPSGSGKTTTALRLEDYLKNLGVKVCVIHMDNFFLPLDRRPPELTDWESPYCVGWTPQQFDLAVQKIIHSRRIYIIGVRSAASLAGFCSFILTTSLTTST